MVARPPDEEVIFKIAAGIASEGIRSDYLQQVCCGDTVLLDRVLTLLHAHEDPGFLESPSPSVLADMEFPPFGAWRWWFTCAGMSILSRTTVARMVID